MYHIHTTPGFIIDSRPYGEAGKILSIFTRDLGFIQATAQGLRLEKSKLRYHSQEYSQGFFSLVRGKEFWRLTSVQALADVVNTEVRPPRLRTESMQLIARIALLLRRFLHGEETNTELFECLSEFLKYLSGNNDFQKSEYLALENITVFRILKLLGYIGQEKKLEPYSGTNLLSGEILIEAEKHKMLLVNHINKALKESQM